MIFRNFGKSNLKISLLGLGCMRFPILEGKDNSQIDIEKTKEIIDIAIKNNVNYFDTAYFYHSGNSEKVLGEILKGYKRESFYIADKLPLWKVEKEEDLEEIFTSQLKRLNMEYFDFYLLHGLSKEQLKLAEQFKAYEFLKEKQRQGFIKHLGFSFHDTPEVLEEILDKYQFEFAQIQYNYLDFHLQRANEQLDILRKRNIPAIIMEPVRGGFLAKVHKSTKEEMEKINKNLSPASYALRFAMAPENVICVLSGMTTIEQLLENVNTASEFKGYYEGEEELYKKAYEDIMKLDIVPCTQCRYCMDCPAGVEIPEILNSHNLYVMGGGLLPYKRKYTALKEEQRAKSCIDCKVCTERCPQKIDIPTLMERITQFWADKNL